MRKPPLIELSSEGYSYMVGAESIGILLVDDEDDVRRLVGRALQQGGFSVIEAASGEEALELLSRDRARIQLLITDVIMPGMNGSELADQVSRRRPEVKVLFISGCAGHILPPGVRFLQKPFGAKALLREVAAVLHLPLVARAKTA